MLKLTPYRVRTAQSGTATIETVLVIIPLMAVVFLAPLIAAVFLDLQTARAEAHRDTFSKTSAMVLMPSALMSANIKAKFSSQFGAITEGNRQHIFATFPPSVPDSSGKPDDLIDPPEGVSIKFGAKEDDDTAGVEIEFFDGGFPNNTVEGWEYVNRPGVFENSDRIHFMTYGATIRSPWTYLGWPFIPAQDLIYEPAQMQGWAGKQVKVDKDMRKRLKIAP